MFHIQLTRKCLLQTWLKHVFPQLGPLFQLCLSFPFLELHCVVLRCVAFRWVSFRFVVRPTSMRQQLYLSSIKARANSRCEVGYSLSLLRLLLLLLPLPFLPSSPLILFATHWTSLIRAPFHLRNETNFATFFVPSDLLSNHASLKAQVEAKVSPNESSELINPSIKAELSRWHSLYVRARWWSACF